MPTLKQKKNGDHIIHKSGDTHPVNTFQVTDDGAEIVKTSGTELEEYFPDQLFYLLDDLGHLSTTGEGGSGTGISKISNIDWATEELSVEERVNVATQIVDKHGVDQLFEGDAAEWVLTITGKAAIFLEPLVREIANATGYSYDTIDLYCDRLTADFDLLETALCAYLQTEGLRSKEFSSPSESTGTNEVLGTDGEFVYMKIGETPRPQYDIAGEIPDPLPDGLRAKIVDVYSHSVTGDSVYGDMEPNGFAELSRIESRSRYDVEEGMVLPRERLEDFPVELPPRSELTEQYEAFRLLQNHVNHVLESPNAGVEHGDGSPCDQWYGQIQGRLQDGSNGADGLGVQQANRAKHSTQLYRDCYGDGEQVTDFACLTMDQPSESQRLRLFPFGIFEHDDVVDVPVAPESETPLPVYPQSEQELLQASMLLAEFPDTPSIKHGD